MSTAVLRQREQRISSLRRRVTSQPRGFLIAVLLLAVVVFVAAFPGLVAPYDPLATNPGAAYQGPSWAHPFGTDQLGRDLLSRVIYGARYSLTLGLAASAIGAVGGITIGLLAGYARGVWDRIFSRFLDVLLAFPDVLLALITITVLGIGQTNLIWAIGIGRIPGAARLVRSQVIQVRESGFIQSAVGLGLPRRQIVWRHVLPNSVGPLLVSTVLGVGLCIIFGAGLSFLGLGAQPPTPEWGLMLSEARQYLSVSAWIGLWPGLFLTFTVILITVTGRSLQQRYVSRRSSL